MANKRMFSLDVVDTDIFLEMPVTTQALYFHLGMRADDDGFVSSPKKITNIANCTADDLRVLISKGFVIPFESGIVVIADWKTNNYIRRDRYRPTAYRNEKKLLEEKEGKYIRSTNGIPVDIPDHNQMDTQVRLGKDSIEKHIVGQSPAAYPYKEIIEYLNEKAGTHFRPETLKTRSLIRQRFRESFTLEDFEKVITCKVKEWKGTENEKYIRPETLFGTKFEGYLNHAPAIPVVIQESVDPEEPEIDLWTEDEV
ncbi:MAG: conserved phage C-terminal domain-containing protein [Blautia sp.]